jgi:hypothetical protein
LGADKAGGDDFRVIEYEKVSGGKKGGEVTNREIGDLVCGTAEEKEAGGVAGMRGRGSNPIWRDSDRKEFLLGGSGHVSLTECATWGTFHP